MGYRKALVPLVVTVCTFLLGISVPNPANLEAAPTPKQLKPGSDAKIASASFRFGYGDRGRRGRSYHGSRHRGFKPYYQNYQNYGYHNYPYSYYNYPYSQYYYSPYVYPYSYTYPGRRTGYTIYYRR